MSLDEYHARQVANSAKNQVSSQLAEQGQLRRNVTEIRAHLEKAVELLGEEITPEAKAELQHALSKLAAIRA